MDESEATSKSDLHLQVMSLDQQWQSGSIQHDLKDSRKLGRSRKQGMDRCYQLRSTNNAKDLPLARLTRQQLPREILQQNNASAGDHTSLTVPKHRYLPI